LVPHIKFFNAGDVGLPQNTRSDLNEQVREVLTIEVIELKRGTAQMNRTSLVTLVLITISCFTGTPCMASVSKPSLELNCLDRPFLGVAVSTPERNAIPTVQLTLRDPLGRAAGAGIKHTRIPHSRYGNVVQIPNDPERSRMLAVEICDARQGVYTITIREGGNSRYRLEVIASGKDSLFEPLHRSSRDGRILINKFAFKIQSGAAKIIWLDKTEKPLDQREIDDW